MSTAKTPKTQNPIPILLALSGSLLALDLAFLIFSTNTSKSITLLKNQLVSLRQQERLISSNQVLYAQYEKEIDTVSRVFPSENTLPLFIQTIESLVREISPEYSLKFTTQSPIPSQSYLILPFTLSLKSDLENLNSFLDKLETIPYLVHVLTINSKTPNNFSQSSETTLSLVVYVQNPFTSPK